MTITQLIQSSPANANELFAKLAATSGGAIKTRESLFNELKAELELHSRLEEEHLFPALRKHKETKNLVRAAGNGNKQARALLAELDGMPKDGEDFLTKLEELRKAFQRHVRDEKKELLPAVKTALSSEEAQAITDKVEADKASREDAKRQVAQERRAAARQERDKAERRRAQAEARQQLARQEQKRQQAEIRAEKRRIREEEVRRRSEAEAEQRRAREAGAALARTGESLVRGGQALAATGASVADASTAVTLSNSSQMGGMVADAVGVTGAFVANAVQSYSDRARPAMESLQAFASLSPLVSGTAAEAGKAWLELWKQTAESRGRRSVELMRCLTPQQAAQVQSRYVGDTMQSWLDANSRMLEVSFEACRALVQPIARGTESISNARNEP